MSNTSCRKATDCSTRVDVEARREVHEVSRKMKSLESFPEHNRKCWVLHRKHRGSKGRIMVDNKGDMSSHPRLIDYFDLSTPFTAFSQKHPSLSSQVWGILCTQGWAPYKHLNSWDNYCVNLKPLWRLISFRDVKGFRREVTHGWMGVAALGALTLYSAPVCF